MNTVIQPALKEALLRAAYGIELSRNELVLIDHWVASESREDKLPVAARPALAEALQAVVHAAIKRAGSVEALAQDLGAHRRRVSSWVYEGLVPVPHEFSDLFAYSHPKGSEQAWLATHLRGHDWPWAYELGAAGRKVARAAWDADPLLPPRRLPRTARPAGG